MAGARQGELAGGLEAWPGRAEVSVRVLGWSGFLRGAGCQQRDLVHYILHLVSEGFWLLYQLRLRHGVAEVLLSVCVAAELQCGAEAFAGTRATFEGGLHHADDATRRLAPRVARARLVHLQWRWRREGYFTVLAHIAEIEVEFASTRRSFSSGWRQAQCGRAGVGCDVPDLLQSSGRQL